MNRKPAALVLDDDIWCLRLMTGMLQQCFPDLDVVARTEPDISGRFDVYFIDNLFGGELLAGRLAGEIRAKNPDSLVIAFSGALDRETLKALIAAGCNGVCDKTIAEDLPTTMTLTQRYLEELSTGGDRAESGFIGALRSIQNLLREWNARLEQESRIAG